MKKARWLIAVAGFTVIFGTPVLSQQADKLSLVSLVEEWSQDTGVVVTAAGKTTAMKLALLDFGNIAMTEGVEVATVDKLAGIMILGGSITTEAGGKYGYWTDGNVKLPISSPNEYQAILAAFSEASVSKLLRKRPRIKITVEPIPPIDYVILINGNLERTTEQGEYLVDEGLTQVLVHRGEREDCTWEGTLAEGDVKLVHCQM